jgi:hypothetical protein
VAAIERRSWSASQLSSRRAEVAMSSYSTNMRTSSAPSHHPVVIIRDSQKRGSAL